MKKYIIGVICIWWKILFVSVILSRVGWSMNKIKTTLQKIIGRIKNNMPTIQITAGMALITIGFVFLIWGLDRADAIILFCAIGFIILGSCAWYASLVGVKKEEEKDRKERKAFLKVIRSIDRQMKRLRKDLKPKGKEDGK